MEQLTTINILLITLAATTQCFGYNPEEGTIQTESKDDSVAIKHDTHRGKRSENTNADPRQNCTTWSPWINRHHPTDSDPNDSEHVSQQEMDAFCPSDHGGKVTEIECKDERNETFHNNFTSSDHAHFISCTNPFLGVECVMLMAESKHCPDLSMRYHCVCSNVTLISSAASTVPSRDINIVLSNTGVASASTEQPNTTLNHGVTANYTEKRTTYEVDGFNAGRLFVPWWILYLSVALILFSICMCTTVCMYKHLQKKLNSSRKQTRVRPVTWREF